MTSALLRRIERYRDRVLMPECEFGRAVLRDKDLLADVRSGRKLRSATVIKIESYLTRMGG